MGLKLTIEKAAEDIPVPEEEEEEEKPKEKKRKKKSSQQKKIRLKNVKYHFSRIS